MLRVAWHASARQVRQRAALSACACVQPQYHHQQHQLQHGRALHAATPVARRKRRYTAPGEDGIDVKYWTGDGMWRETAARQAEVIAAAGEFGNEETDRMFEAHSRRQKRIDQQGKLSYHYDPKLPPTDRPRMVRPHAVQCCAQSASSQSLTLDCWFTPGNTHQQGA